ncbi:AAA family ATPase, partial [Lacisediminimonas sp.]|uniref:AAA family ATPase n=1 Tax=Lacisediminimonas sp. TaxID=3060582 RepID=UPI00271DDDCF
MSMMEMPDHDVLLARSFASRVTAWAKDQAEARAEPLAKDAARRIYRAAWHVSRATSSGHVCVLLADIVQEEQGELQGAGQGAAPADQHGEIAAESQQETPDDLVADQDLDRYLEQYLGQPDEDDGQPLGEHDHHDDFPADQPQDRQSARQAEPPQGGQQDLFSEQQQSGQQDLFNEPSQQPQGDALHHAGQTAPVPDIAAWRSLLLTSGVVGTAQQPGAFPLILDASDRLYLHKYFGFEKSLARRVRQADWSPGLPSAPTRELLGRLFARGATDHDDGQPDWQKIAAALALLRPITIISGGPGTGKTTTVANILACLVADNPGCRVALAAPTGRAAARMLAALNARAASIPAELVARFPQQSFTVHRLLGVTPSPGVFRHDAQRPLPVDVVVVDEASMLDLALAARLFDAVPQRARIILLGDMDQLAAVEAGSVFSDLSANPTLGADVRQDVAKLTGIAPALLQPSAPARGQGVTDAVVWLTRNYRFGKDSAIGQLAALVVAGAAADTLAWLQQQQFPHIDWIADDGDELPPAAMALAVESFLPYTRVVQVAEQDPQAVLAAFDQFRVLCAIRNTGRGV